MNSRNLIWPSFFIVGAAKCGTTSLWDHLKSHPQVFLPGIKEPHYFTSDVQPPEFAAEHCTGDLETYQQLYQPAKGFAAIGDASTGYLWDQNAARRIHEVSPNAKIIVILRDPVVRAHSQYLMELLKGVETEQSFYKALRREVVPNEACRLLTYLYVEAGMYYAQVHRYLEIFGRDQVLVLLFDDLTTRPQVVLSRVTEHIGVESISLDTAELSAPVNPYRKQRFGTAHRLATRVLSRDLRRKLFPPAVSRWLRYNSLLYDTKKPPLDAQSRRYLEEIYDPDISRLEELLGRKLPELRKSWKVAETTG